MNAFIKAYVSHIKKLHKFSSYFSNDQFFIRQSFESRSEEDGNSRKRLHSYNILKRCTCSVSRIQQSQGQVIPILGLNFSLMTQKKICSNIEQGITNVVRVDRCISCLLIFLQSFTNFLL